MRNLATIALFALLTTSAAMCQTNGWDSAVPESHWIRIPTDPFPLPESRLNMVQDWRISNELEHIKIHEGATDFLGNEIRVIVREATVMASPPVQGMVQTANLMPKTTYQVRVSVGGHVVGLASPDREGLETATANLLEKAKQYARQEASRQTIPTIFKNLGLTAVRHNYTPAP